MPFTANMHAVGKPHTPEPDDRDALSLTGRHDEEYSLKHVRTAGTRVVAMAVAVPFRRPRRTQRSWPGIARTVNMGASQEVRSCSRPALFGLATGPSSAASDGVRAQTDCLRARTSSVDRCSLASSNRWLIVHSRSSPLVGTGVTTSRIESCATC